MSSKTRPLPIQCVINRFNRPPFSRLSFLTYRFLRFSRRLEPFDSPQLDELAGRMGVVRRLNGRERYFLSSRGYSAFSFPGGIAFGKGYWDHLGEGERLAIAAHEFSHIRSNDAMTRFLRIGLPSLALALAIMLGISSVLIYGPSNSVDTLELAGVTLGTVLVFLCSYTLMNLVNAPWRRRMELRCDTEAAKYTNGEDLIRALSLWQGAISEKAQRTFRYRIQSRSYPTLEDRVRAIRAVM